MKNSGSAPAPKAPRYRTLNSRNFCARQEELFQKNHLDANRPFDGMMYETFGPEVEFVRKLHETAPERIVTVIHGDSGSSWYIARGFHYVNRVGYLVAKDGAVLPEFADFRY